MKEEHLKVSQIRSPHEEEAKSGVM